jgi:integrase
MLCILLMLGTRGGEFFALRRNDYQPGGLMLDEVVRPKHGVSPIMKTELSKDLMYLPPELEQQLVAWMEKMPDQRPEAFLFPSEAGTPIAANNFNKRDLKSLVERAKRDRVKRRLEVPEGYLQGITPQSFRTTCAIYSSSRELGGLKDAQAIMRHSSPETTGKTYMQSIPESVKSTMQAVAEKVRSGRTSK